jgi:hypothetical protein
MRALSKLIYLNNPDLVLFVGEALVGNDAVDQLSKFNQVLIYIYLVVVFLSNYDWVFVSHFLHMSVIEPIYFVAETGRPLHFSYTQIDRWDLAHKV